MSLRDIYNELKRRNVIKVATVYGITAWVLAQVVSLAAGAFAAPPWVMKMVIILLLAGFPLALIFAWAFELTPEGIRKTDHVDKDASQTQQTGQKLNRMIIAALAGLLLVLGVERLWFAGSYVDESHGSGEVNQASIAVLPFENLSSDKENEYFSSGLSEELLNELARIDKMKVSGRTSSFRFKGENQNPKQIAQQLNVRHILEGSVRKAGNKVRITTQLIDTETGSYVWSKTYDRTLNDIFAIQEEISKAVLSELKVRLLPKDKDQLEAIPTHDVESYQHYLKANQVIASRRIEDINQAIDLYKEAISLDPAFAKAHAKLAMAYFLKRVYGGMPIEEAQAKIREEADRALLLDGDLGEAYAAIGLYYDNIGEYEKSRDAYVRSLELNPNQPYVHGWLGILYAVNLSNPHKASKHVKQMYELDRLAPLAIYNYAHLKVLHGAIQEASQLLQKNIRLNPDFLLNYPGLAYIKSLPPFGQLDEAVQYNIEVIKKDSSLLRPYYYLTELATDLNLPSMASYYFEQLEEYWPNSKDYINTLPVIGNYTGNYKAMTAKYFPYFEEYGQSNIDVYDFMQLAHYGFSTGKFENVLREFKKRNPKLFQQNLDPVDYSNFQYANLLINIYNAKGDVDRAQQLTQAYCAGIGSVKDNYAGGAKAPLYIEAKANCLLHQNKFEQALPFVRKYFIAKNGIWLSSLKFKSPMYQEAMRRPGYQEVREQVYAELDRQRENVIAYLKKEGIWRTEWNEELSSNN